MTDKKATAVVVPFPRFAKAKLPVAKLDLPPGFIVPRDVPVTRPTLDLSGKPKVWFLIGRGRIGKTTVARWVCETAENRGGSFIVVALDPINRSLTEFRNNVETPPSSDPGEVKEWLSELLMHAADNKLSVIIDMGGGDTSLALLLKDNPDLAGMLSGAGLEAVAVHVVGADQTDLMPMALTEALGFKPRATLVVLNEAHGGRDKFDAVVSHPVMTSVRERGGVEVWMPVLTRDAAQKIDAHHWQFVDAQKLGGMLTASAVHSWLSRMGDAFAPVMSWLPE